MSRGVVILGYVFAHSLERLERGLKYWSFGFIALIVTAAVVFTVRRRRRA